MPEIKSIPVENLQIDVQNPRYGSRPMSQREAIEALAKDQGDKLINLAIDIADKGLNPSELPIVMGTEDDGIFTVLEGNRRIASLKLVTAPLLLDSIDLPNKLTKRFKDLYDKDNSNIPNEVTCVVFSNRDEATHWILLRHTGSNDGVGIVSWDGTATARFRGSSPALQAIEHVAKSRYLDDETREKLDRIAITNVARLLDTPEVRKEIGINIQDSQLIFTNPNEDEAIGRLAHIVSDIANRRIKVSDIDKKDQRVTYAKEVVSRPLPQLGGKSPSSSATGATSGIAAKDSNKVKPGRTITPDRRMLIPKQFKITIPHTRINQIYHELRTLDVTQFSNSCAVMLRVFIELSIDDYAQRNNISLKGTPRQSGGSASASGNTMQSWDMSLRDKIKTIYQYMESNNICNPADLKGIKSLYANRDHVLSVDSLNAYVHNKSYTPAPSDLKANWDSIQTFVAALWV